MKKTYSEYKRFVPHSYNSEYYTSIGKENDELLRFIYTVLHTSRQTHTSAIDFGCGPTLYTALTLSFFTEKIYLCDYLESNLEQIVSWVKGTDDAFNWTTYTRYLLSMQQNNVSKDDVMIHEDRTRKSIKDVMKCDLFQESKDRILHQNGDRMYDLVVSNFVIDSITSDLFLWNEMLDRLLHFLKPGGRLILSSLVGANHYKVKGKTFSAVNLTPEYIKEQLLCRNIIKSSLVDKYINSEQNDTSDPGYHGYSGMYFTSIIKI